MRLALITDIHEDIINLKKILKRIEKTGYDLLICLGDISGFSAPFYKYLDTRNAHECLLLLRDKCDIILPGNHDFHAARRIPKESNVFSFPDNWYELDFKEKLVLADDRIWLHEIDDLDPLYSNGDIEFLQKLPEYHILKTSDHNILLSHYAFPNLSGFEKGFYIQEKDFSGHFDFMKGKDCSLSFTGHAHVRGFYTVTPKKFRHYRYRKLQLKEFPVCIGVHPVTRHKKRSGFCIFDIDKSILQAVKCG